MVRRFSLALACFICSQSVASAATPSPTTHFYFSEFKRPTRGSETTATVDVAFFVRPRTATAEGILRAEMTTALKFAQPTFDILGNAWFSPTGDEAEEEVVKLTGAADALLYERSTGKIRAYKLLDELRKGGLNKK